MQRSRFPLLAVVLVIFSFGACDGEDRKPRTIQVSNGDVLIVGVGNDVALIKIVAQSLNPEVIDYECVWREDGLSVFGEGDQRVKRKSGNHERDLRFGPFVIGWSVEGSGGKGWLYFDRFPGGVATPTAMKFLVTKQSEIKDVSPDQISTLMKEP